MSLSRTDDVADKPQFTLRNLFALTTLFGASVALMAAGTRSESMLYGYGILAGAILLTATVLISGARLETRPGAMTRIVIAIILICLLLSPLLFPAVR